MEEQIVFTIGHSNHSTEKFLALLRQHHIGQVVDIRSIPHSRYASHFNRNKLEALLRSEGIDYIYMGDVLGGRPADAAYYDEERKVLYDRLAASADFQRGIERLCDMIGSKPLAVMCSEESPEVCHRHLLIARVLRERNINVLHIRGDGRLESESDIKNCEKQDGQLSLFG